MTQPQNQPDNENEGLTREFNFPKPWIKDYNPMLHGIKPGMEAQQSSTPPITGQQPWVQPGVQPGPQPFQAPQYPVASQPPPTGYAQPNLPGQWNPTGVYGGQAEKQKGVPTWVWTLISAVVLIIVLLVLYFVVLR